MGIVLDEISDFLDRYMFDENFILGMCCFTTDSRVPDNEVPKGLYKYETRFDDDLCNPYGTLENHVFVNFGVTVIFPKKIDLGKDGYIDFQKEW